MKSLKIQPTFGFTLEVPPEVLMARLHAVLSNQPSLGEHSEIASAGQCIDVKVPSQHQRFWSPHLNAHVSEHLAGSNIYCRFSPRPEIWTMVMAVYLIAAFFIFCSAIYGYAQWMMGAKPWALLFILVGLLVIISLHLASLVGQKWSEDQMVHLRTRLEQVIEQAAKE